MNIATRNPLRNLRKLSSVQTIKDVPQLTHALFPGTHCPLMGALMVVRGIKDALAVIVGTDECTYYGKSMALGSNKFGGINGRCVSVVLEQHDITFGSNDKVLAAFHEIMEDYKPSCIFLISTCIIEIIGDDFDALATEVEGLYNIPVLSIHTEHFKSEDHLPGLEYAITACAQVMDACPTTNKVNILGQRMGDFSTTELSRILQQANIAIGLQLPSDCTLDEIRTAASAQANIVVNEIALPLAQLMEEKFGVPYITFNKYVLPDNIYHCYVKLLKYLNMPLP